MRLFGLVIFFSSGSFGASWAVFGGALERLGGGPGASWRRLGSVLGYPGRFLRVLPIFNRSEAVLESSWGRLGGVFRPFWGVFGGVLRRVFREMSGAKQAFLIFGIKMKCWRPLGSVLGFLEVLWAVFEVS